MSYAINVIWMDKAGEEEIKKENLAEAEEYETETFFNHFWIFKKAGSDEQLAAKIDNMKETVFEGSRFGAEVDDILRVTIEEIGNYDINLFQ